MAGRSIVPGGWTCLAEAETEAGSVGKSGRDRTVTVQRAETFRSTATSYSASLGPGPAEGAMIRSLGRWPLAWLPEVLT